jgi:hypothetical protein
LEAENGTNRSGDISACYPLNRGIKVIECLALDDLGANFATNPKRWETTFDDDEPVLTMRIRREA